MTAEEVKTLLRLEPHLREGGWFVRSYASEDMLAQDAVGEGRYDGPRHCSTAIYYLLEPHTFSEMHRLRSDEIFHFYAGDPVEMLQLLPDGEAKIVVLGSDLAKGQRPQVLVPREVWQGSRLIATGRWALLGCTVSPGFEYADYETGDVDELQLQWPAFAEMIQSLSRD